MYSIFDPKDLNILTNPRISLMSGTFSKWHLPFTSNVAGSIPTAAFLAPLIVTSPCSLHGPCTTNFSINLPPKNIGFYLS